MPKVSVIITSYNKGEYLSEAIDSVLSQTFNNYELIIIDDGSSDNSREIIDSYHIKNSQIKPIYQENIGVIKTRNKAINIATGEYIVQLDGDDKIHKDFLSWTVPELDQNPKTGIIFCQTEFFGKKSGVWNLGEYNIQSQLTSNLIVISALFRKNDFDKTQGYSDQFNEGLEDWDFWLSLIETGVEVKEIKKVGFYYRIIDNSRNQGYSASTETKLKRLIYIRHSNLYLENGLDPVNLLWELKRKESQIYDLNLIKNSPEYKLGRLLLRPFRFLQKK